MTEIPTFPPPAPSPRAPFLAIIVVAAVAGAAGAALLFSLFPEFRQAEIPPGTRSVIVHSPGTVVVEEAGQVENVAREVTRQIGALYSGVTIDEDATLDGVASYAQAVILTDDGWIVGGGDITVGDIFWGDTGPVRVSLVAENVELPGITFAKLDASGRLIESSFVTEIPNPGTSVLAITSFGELLRSSFVGGLQPLPSATAGLFMSDKPTHGMAVGFPANVFPPGTPVFSLGAELVGVTVSTQSDSRLTTIVPVDDLSLGLAGAFDSDAVSQPAGITYRYVKNTKDEASYLEVTNVEVGSVAQKSGLIAGDRIVRLDDRELSGPHDLRRAAVGASAGDSLPLEVQRGKRTITISLLFES